MRCVMSLCSKAVDFSMFTFSMNAQNVEAGKKKKKKKTLKKKHRHTHRNGNPELLRVRLDFCQASGRLLENQKKKKLRRAEAGRDSQRQISAIAGTGLRETCEPRISQRKAQLGLSPARALSRRPGLAHPAPTGSCAASPYPGSADHMPKKKTEQPRLVR